MPQSTKPIPQLNSYLRVVGEEESPVYDASPQPARKHRTMTDDDIVDSVCATCGMAAAGLYWQMERLVGRDGEWQISVGDLAEKFGTDVRRIQESMAKLIEKGWVERIEKTNRFGVTSKNVWKLPFHETGRTYEGASEGASGARLGVRLPPPQPAPLNVDTVDTVKTVDKSTVKGSPKKPTSKRTQYTEAFEQFWRRYPTGEGVKTLAFAEWQKLDEEDHKVVMAALPAWLACEKWELGFVRACERWLKLREFEQTPAPRQKAKLTQEHPNAARHGKWVG